MIRHQDQRSELTGDCRMAPQCRLAKSSTAFRADRATGHHSRVKISRISCERLPAAAPSCFESPTPVRAFVILLSAHHRGCT